MSLSSPALIKARQAMLERRAQRSRPDYLAPGSLRHDQLREAFQSLGEERYLRILYCPTCLRGHAVDLVSELPADAWMARELGLRQQRPWRLDCPDKQAA